MLLLIEKIFLIENGTIAEKMTISSEHFHTLMYIFHLSNHRCSIRNKNIYVLVALIYPNSKNCIRLYSGFFHKIIFE